MRALDDAVAQVADGDASPRAFALAGLHALLAESDATKAQTYFDQALSRETQEPYALYGQLLLSARLSQSHRLVAIAFDLIERNPRHPLSAVAARLVRDHTMLAQSIDDVILARAAVALTRSTLPDTAHLLRLSVLLIAQTRGDETLAATMLADMGTPTSGSFLGPTSPWRLLSLTTPTRAEQTGVLESITKGPLGPLAPRVLQFRDGTLSLASEGSVGNGYLLAFDAEVTDSGTYVVRTRSSTHHVVTIDGTEVISRRAWQRAASTGSAQGVSLDAGWHRVMVRLTRDDASSEFHFALQRADALPSKINFKPAVGPAPTWAGVRRVDSVFGAMPNAKDTFAAFADEVSEGLASFIAARDGLGRDRDGARSLIAQLPPQLAGATVRLLSAQLEMGDPALAPKVAKGRATRDVELALTQDPQNLMARLLAAEFALEDNRLTDALDLVRQARSLPGPLAAPVSWLTARIELALGLDAQAIASANETLKAWPGHCDAVLLQYDIARRKDALAEADALLSQTLQCPGSAARVAEHHRTRGRMAGVVEAWKRELDRHDDRAVAASSLANALVSLKRFDEAIALLSRFIRLWPRNASLWKHLGDVLELAGRSPDALAIRERALLVDGADLALRRTVERQKNGRELLDERAVSTAAALKAYETAPGAEEANAAFLLDAAAIQAFPDGSQVDRVHIIQKALDQAGVQEVAEVQIPPGAAVLTLRTLKPDGKTLEPEGIEGKDSVSLPGVQVGDFVEYEYLLAHPARGPGQPGFTASPFYFQVARQPNNWSTYVVLAPKGSGMRVDAHHLGKVAPVRVEGEHEVFFHEEKGVPPSIPEPGGPPTGTEWLPFVSVGAGQEGTDGIIRSYADAFLERGLITHEVETFAKQAAGAAQGVDAVRAVYAAVMKKLSDRDSGLSMSAGASVSQDRGSRTWLLQASLAALGFDARLAAVRTFTADPAPYVFPNESLFPYVCVFVRLNDGSALWLDPLVRFAPFAELPEFAMGEREAWLFPRPGQEPEKVKTPARVERPAKTVTLTATLSTEGVLTGEGSETYTGFEAAQLAEALEQLTSDQRQQGLEQALSRLFGGADLKSVEVDMQREIGAAVKISYRFTASRFARPEGGSTLVLGALTLPWNLGRRFLSSAQRVTPLFIPSTESTVSTVTVTVPEGFRLKDPVTRVQVDGPWGRLTRTEDQQGNTITIKEESRLVQSRVPPKSYPRFAQFAGESDLLQGRDLILAK
jgi:tetratricopeptide (TPR) repeat protein